MQTINQWSFVCILVNRCKFYVVLAILVFMLFSGWLPSMSYAQEINFPDPPPLGYTLAAVGDYKKNLGNSGWYSYGYLLNKDDMGSETVTYYFYDGNYDPQRYTLEPILESTGNLILGNKMLLSIIVIPLNNVDNIKQNWGKDISILLGVFPNEVKNELNLDVYKALVYNPQKDIYTHTSFHIWRHFTEKASRHHMLGFKNNYLIMIWSDPLRETNIRELPPRALDFRFDYNDASHDQAIWDDMIYFYNLDFTAPDPGFSQQPPAGDTTPPGTVVDTPEITPPGGDNDWYPPGDSPPDGLGKIPLPDNVGQALAGILLPGILSIILGILGQSGAALAPGGLSGLSTAKAGTAYDFGDGRNYEESGEYATGQFPFSSGLYPGLNHGGSADNPFTAFDEKQVNCSPIGLPRYMINTATLNMVIEDTIYRFSGLGPPVDLTFTYNSGEREQTGSFGRGWAFSYDWQLGHNKDTAILTKGSGQKQIYTFPVKAANQAFPIELTAGIGCFDRLLYYGEYWLYMPKGNRFIYRLDEIPGTQQARLTEVSDFHENHLRVGFDEKGRIGTVTDAAGRKVEFRYNKDHFCTAFSLPDGRSASFFYDVNGNLTRVTDLLGITSDYSYDSSNNLTQMVVGREKHTTCFAYHSDGKKVSSVTDSRGYITNYDIISADPVQVQLTDPEGKVTCYQSQGGLTVRIIDPLGHLQDYTYQEGLPTSYRTKGGGTFTFTYDVRGNLTEATDQAGNSWRYAYDAYDNQLEAVNPEGGTWLFTYDRQHKLTEETLPTGGVITREYNSLGQQTAILEARGHRTIFSYDRFGNPEKVTGPLGNSILFGYDQLGLRLVSVTSPQGETTFLEYDHNDRLTRVQHPDGSAREHIYNCCARILTTDENGNSSGLERDPLLFVTRAVDSLSNTASFRYDGNNILSEFTDPKGFKTAYTYDCAGRLTQLIDGLGQQTGYSYDPEGILTSVEEPSGSKTSFFRDPATMFSSETDALGHTVNTKWNSLNRISEYTGARGQSVNYKYDRAGRMTVKSHDGVEVATYCYDAAGNLLELQDISGRTAYSYNEDEKLISINYPEGLQIRYQYDQCGRLETLHYPTGLAVHYSYDNRHRLTGIKWDENRVALIYDAVGNLLEQQRSNDTVTRYTLDRKYRMVGIEHLKNGDPFCRIEYTRDEAGNLIREEGEYPLTYPSPEKDFRMTFNELNQLVHINGKQCSYDPDGNLLEIEGGIWEATFDPENRLKALTRNGNSRTYDYDGLGHRCSASNGTSTRRFYCDQEGKVLCEADQEGALTCYIYMGKVLVASIRPGHQTLFYHFEKTGNTIALTDDAGQIRAAYSYTPSGEYASTGEMANNPFTYVGAHGVMDEGGGLYLMKHRYYDALSGRFVQKDPIGINGGINRYIYANNNPLLYIDPEGTIGVFEFLLICTVIGGALTATSMASLTYESAEAAGRIIEQRQLADDLQKRAIREFMSGNVENHDKLMNMRQEILNGNIAEVGDIAEKAIKQNIGNYVGTVSPDGGIIYPIAENIYETTQDAGPSRWGAIRNWISSTFTGSKNDPCK